MIPESDPFKVPSVTEETEKGPGVGGERKEEWADFYSSDNYVKDNTTNLMMAPTTEETCKANNGFVCKVRLDAGDYHDDNWDDDCRMMVAFGFH